MVLEVSTVLSSGASAVTLMSGCGVVGRLSSHHGGNSLLGLTLQSRPSRQLMSVGRTGQGGVVLGFTLPGKEFLPEGLFHPSSS